jgi:hypothetical protein
MRVKVFGLVELLELIVDGFCFSNVRLHGQELLIPLRDEILEFLLHFQLGQSILQATCFILYEFRQVVGHLLVAVEP